MIVVVATSVDDVEPVHSRLRELGAAAFATLAPAANRRLVLARVNDDEDAERLAAALRAGGAMAIARPADGARLEAWTRHTRPVTFGHRLGVCFAWSEHERPNVARVIEIGPGGWSAQHPSTRLIIEQLLGRVVGGERVLDVGCGSGVLGLCALALGASHVVAVDIKDAAVDATRRNASLNGMERDMDVTADALATIDGQFDIVLANLGREALVDLAPQLVERVTPGGWVAASGISPSQCSVVSRYLDPLGEVERRTSGEWSAVVLEHPGSRAVQESSFAEDARGTSRDTSTATITTR